MRIFTVLLLLSLISCNGQTERFICKPCDLPCDKLTFSAPGTCPHCTMDLIKKSDLVSEKPLILNQIELEPGSGKFLIEGGFKKENEKIKIYYHKPINYTPSSEILIVIPGSGRNADSYRNSWVESSEKFGVLILSPMYLDEDYDYGAYHMGNLIYDLNIAQSATYDKSSNNVFLDEEVFTFKLNLNQQEWIFNDFDRLFTIVAEELGSTQTEYDIFGHSAGGQILHRFAIFQPNSKAKRIIAANSGSYTLPDFESDLPFGIQNTNLSKENIETSFKKKLVLFIGELDNENEKGGLLLRSPTVDKQGLNRLARGTYFYEQSKKIADELNYEFKWELRIIPNIGHNQEGIANRAADFLYGKDNKN